MFVEDYDSRKLQTHGPLYREAGGAEEMGLPSFNQVGGGMPPPNTCGTLIVLEDSFPTRTEPQPYDPAYVTDEMKDQVTGLNDIPTSSKFDPLPINIYRQLYQETSHISPPLPDQDTLVSALRVQ